MANHSWRRQDHLGKNKIYWRTVPIFVLRYFPPLKRIQAKQYSVPWGHSGRNVNNRQWWWWLIYSPWGPHMAWASREPHGEPNSVFPSDGGKTISELVALLSLRRSVSTCHLYSSVNCLCWLARRNTVACFEKLCTERIPCEFDALTTGPTGPPPIFRKTKYIHKLCPILHSDNFQAFLIITPRLNPIEVERSTRQSPVYLKQFSVFRITV